MAHTTKIIAHFALALCISYATRLEAGQVTTFGWHSGVASLAATSIDPAPIPNDNVVGLSPYEIFVTQKNYVGIGPVDITFDVINNGGTTEYAVREGVNNSTGVPWGAYHVELGYGFDAGFVKSTPGDGLDFDFPDYDSGFQFAPGPGFFFPTVSYTEDDIYASGGVMPNGAFAGYFRFSVDVPDGITQFTIRQSPIAVPEPGGIAFALIGLACGVLYRCRTRVLMGEAVTVH
jgi:hypothetical protein